MKSTRRSEPVSYAEVGAFLHEHDGGSATVKTYTSVNEGLKVDAATRTQQIGKVRVEMHVFEDKSVKDGQIYEKGIFMKQIRDNFVGNGTQPISGSEQIYNQPTGAENQSGELTPLKVLKNFVDNIASSQRLMWGIIVGLAIIAGGALALAIIQ